MSSPSSDARTGSQRLLLGITIVAITLGVFGLVARALVAARQGELLLVLGVIAAVALIVILAVIPFRLGVAFRRRELERVPGAVVVDVMTPWNTYATLSATPDGIVVYGGYRRLVVRNRIARADIAAVTAEARPAGTRMLQSIVFRSPRGGDSVLVLVRWGRFWFGSAKPGPAAAAAAAVSHVLGRPSDGRRSSGPHGNG